jgi:hypothetical protein
MVVGCRVGSSDTMVFRRDYSSEHSEIRCDILLILSEGFKRNKIFSTIDLAYFQNLFL